MSIPRFFVVIGALAAAGCYSAKDWDSRPVPPPVRTDHGYVVVEVPAPDYYFHDGAFVATGGRRLVIREMNQQPVDTSAPAAIPTAAPAGTLTTTPAADPSTAATVAAPSAAAPATAPSVMVVHQPAAGTATAATIRPATPATAATASSAKPGQDLAAGSTTAAAARPGAAGTPASSSTMGRTAP